MTIKVNNWIARLALASLIALPSLASATTGYRPVGYGAKSKGMGGVGIALPQDTFAAALNPAGTGYVCTRIDLGLQWLEHNSNATLEPREILGYTPEPVPPQNISSRKEMWWPEIGAVWDSCECCAFGLAAYAFGGWDVDYSKHTFLGGVDFVELDSEVVQQATDIVFEGSNLGMDYQAYFITPSLACTVCGDQMLGASVNIAVATLTIGGTEYFQEDSLFPLYMANNGSEYQSGIGFQVGWIGQFPCNVTLGATYKTRTWMNHFKKYRGFIPEDGNMDIPSLWGFGASWCVCDCVLFAVDFERIVWSDTKLFRHDFLNTGRYGSKSGPGFGWVDQSVVKFGASWDVTDCFTVRGGFNYGTNLFANRDLLLNTLDAELIKHHFTVGFTYYVDCYEFSLDYVKGHRHALRYDESDFASSIRADQSSVGVSLGYRY
jgi:long-chain fatty acid transport protein